MRRMITLTLGGLLLIGTTACGGDDDAEDADKPTTTESDDDAIVADDDAQQYVDAIATQLRGDEVGLQDPAATCLATAMVQTADAAKLQDAGLTPVDVAAADNLASLGVQLPADATAQVAAAITECGAAAAFKTELVDEFVVGFEIPIPTDGVACITSSIADDTVAQTMAGSLVDGANEAIEPMLLATIAPCPVVGMTLLLDGSPNVTEDDKGCVIAFLEAHPDMADAAFASGDPDAPTTLGVELAGVCPDAFA